MQTIHKLALNGDMAQTHELPSDAIFLALQYQRGIPTIWYRCNPECPPAKRTIVVVGTGWPLPDTHKLIYIGTLQADNGLVWHYWEAV